MSIATLFEIINENSSIIIILIFAGIPLLIGSAAATKSVSTISDFFLCNRSLSTTAAFFTIYATWWSSFAFLGSTSSFYSQGPVYWIALGWNVLFGLLFLIIGSRLWEESKRLDLKTPIGFFQKHYHSKQLNNMVILVMILFSIPYIETQFIGGGILIEMATNGAIPWKFSTLLFLIVMIIYLWSGGLRAVAWTDAFYAVLIFFGMLIIGVIFTKMTGGISEIFESIAQNNPDLLRIPTTINGIKGYGFWVSMLIIMPLGEIMMPQIWTRTYAIKKKVTFHIMPFLLSAATVAYVGTMLAGNAAIVLEPRQLASSDYILPIMMLKHVAPPLMAFIMCCAAAACLSTANSQLHSISQMITLDIYKVFINKKATEKHLVFAAKLMILAFAVFSYLLLLYVSSTSIIETAYLSFSGMMQLIVPVAGGLFWRKASAAGAITGLSAGIAITLLFSFSQPFTYYFSPSLLALLINSFLFIIIGHISYRKQKMGLGGAS